MVDAWPSDLPHCFTLESFASGAGNGLIRSNPDAGPAKVRRRSSAVPKPLVGTLPMTYAELATLEAFVATTLLGGSLPFTFPSQRGGDDLLVRFSGDGDLLPWRKLGAGRVVVDVKLEILP